jgi:glycosyltransferase involved in cell wall biosynthesis
MVGSMCPLVSILIPCYNAGPWIAQCIQSALDQTYEHKEIVVVDDGSQDNSLEIVRSFGDRIRVESGLNRGANVARNQLLHLSNGQWLSFLDADDYLLPQKIERQIALVNDRSELDAVYSPMLDLYPNSTVRPDPAVVEGTLHATYPFVDEDLYANYFRWNYFSTTALLLKKAAIIEIGGWNVEEPICHEHELVLRLMLAGKYFAFMPERLAVYRVQYLHSISRGAPLKTRVNRMALSDRLEAHLYSKGEMTEIRRVALAQARVITARSAYSLDPSWARLLCAKALATGPFPFPQSFNKYYIHAFRALGFGLAEILAKIGRGLSLVVSYNQSSQ